MSPQDDMNGNCVGNPFAMAGDELRRVPRGSTRLFSETTGQPGDTLLLSASENISSASRSVGDRRCTSQESVRRLETLQIARTSQH